MTGSEYRRKEEENLTFEEKLAAQGRKMDEMKAKLEATVNARKQARQDTREEMAAELEKRGVPKVALNDLARDDMPECVEDAFRYDKLVLATTTFNSEIFPFMREFIDMLVERNYQKRTIAFIENGSWAPTAMKVMKKKLDGKFASPEHAGPADVAAFMDTNDEEEIAFIKRDAYEQMQALLKKI